MRRFKSVPFTSVELTGDFWRERLETVLSRTVPSQYRQLVAHNMIEGLDVRQPPPPLTIPRNSNGFTTQIFWDSDIGKWVEVAAYALRHERNPEIEAQVDDIAERYEKAQLTDGYANTWYIGREIENRWTNLRDNHELYNAGHLLEGAIAYYQATGKRKLLDVVERYLDHIRTTFGTGEGQRRGYPGHQEIEIALVKLFHLTGEKKHLDLAAYFIDERGRQPHYYDQEAALREEKPEDFIQKTYEYNQSHKPVREQEKVVGHAVRAMYMYAAVADLAADLDDPDLKRACEVLWDDVTSSRMYVTGGFGPAEANEGFTTDYDLPNDTAYAETCASVAMIFWAQRMLNLDLDGRYADIMELALFNGALAGLSWDGESYFYENKLESDGTHRRWAWHPCPCCTMNASRLIASVGGYFYSTGTDEIAVHLYGGTKAALEVGGRSVAINEVSDYPWNGTVRLEIDPEPGPAFALRLRIPGWAEGCTAEVNGEPVDMDDVENGYLPISRDWSTGDVVSLNIPMPVERIFANPNVRMDLGRVALRRGPLVYCLEQVDNPEQPVFQIALPRATPISAEHRSDLHKGVTVLKVVADVVADSDWGSDLYRTEPPKHQTGSLVAVPYYMWANRDPGPMTVWIREARS